MPHRGLVQGRARGLTAAPLPAAPAEIERLAFEGAVWRPFSESLFDRLGIGPGARCLEVGAGIGIVSLPLAQRVGPAGRVTAVEASTLYAETLREEAARKDIANLTVFEGDAARFPVKRGAYDLIYSRWFLSGRRDAERLLARLVPGLKRGGVLAVEDFHLLECGYYPRRPGFEAVLEASRRWFEKRGALPRLAGELPAVFNRLGLRGVEVLPHVRAAGPGTELWRWSEQLFLGRLPELVADRDLSVAAAERFRRELAALRRVPGALFVVPGILDVVGRRP